VLSLLWAIREREGVPSVGTREGWLKADVAEPWSAIPQAEVNYPVWCSRFAAGK